MLDKLILRFFLWPTMHSFFGIGQGPSGEEKQMYGLMANVGKFGTSQGESDISKASNFWDKILSGDMSQISTVLGPQMSAINKQAQQQKLRASEFGTRSGGSAALMGSIDTDALSSIRSMVSNLTAGAAGNLGNMGQNLLNTGASASSTAFQEANVIHDQNKQKWNDIFNSIAQTVGMVAGIPGMPGGGNGGILQGIAGTLQG